MDASARINLTDQRLPALHSLFLFDQLAIYMSDWKLGSSLKQVMIDCS